MGASITATQSGESGRWQGRMRIQGRSMEADAQILGGKSEMSTPHTESTLITAAQAGDRAAMGELLMMHAPALSRRMAPRVPRSLQRVASVDDILQQTFADAYRDVGRFEAREAGSFFAWLQTIAENRLRNAIKAAGRQKRGGERQQFDPPPGALTSVRDLLGQVAGMGETASVGAVRGEALSALNVAVAELPDDYREVIQLRYFSGKSIDEAADAMGRTPSAIRALTDRAKKRLREVIARLST